MTLEKYNAIISKLMANDKNSGFDEIMYDCENNLEYACEVLRDTLDRIIAEHELEGEYLEFYQKILNEGWDVTMDRKIETMAMDIVKDVWIVKITYTGRCEFSVCRGYDEENKNWSYSVAYCETLSEAREIFIRKISEV